jgi:cell division protein FtsB
MRLKVVVGLMVLGILGFTILGEHGVLKLVRYRQQRQEFVKEASRLREENEKLRQDIESLQNDPSFIERVARENLGMVKPGEFVIQFTDPKPADKVSP